jgi:hypothetical protein
MRNRSWNPSIATALGLLLSCSAGAQQASTASPERVEVVGTKAEVSEWFLAQSPHFSVYSDAREEDVAQLLDNLEKLDHLLRIYTQPVRPAEPQEPRLTLYFHSRPSDLRDVAEGMPADAVGFYSSCASGVRGFGVHLERIPSLGDEQLEKSPLNDTLSYVFEAYARHFLYRHTDIRSPAFFIDGFALYFSSVRFSERQMVVGRVPATVGGYLRFLDQGRRYSLEYEDVLQERLANARNYAGDAGVRLEFEAKSWLLTHYMLSSDDKRKRLSRYLALTAAGTAPAAAFEKTFGVKVADIGTVLWRYGLKGMEVLRVAPPSLHSARVSFRSLPRAAGEFVLADAALRSCPGRRAGESLLKKVADLAARFPHDKLARLTLSRAQIDWGDPRDALPRLDALLQEDEASFEAQYLAGMAHLRMAASVEGDGGRTHLQAAQRHLQRARELDPRSTEAAFAAFRAEVAATDAPGDAALAGVVSAWQAAREVDTLAKAAVLASAYSGRADEAHQWLAPLAQDMRDKPMAEWARQWRGRLEAGVTRADILAEMRRTAVADAPFKEWTIDKKSVLQAVERGYGLEAADSFIKAGQEKDRTAMPGNTTNAGPNKRP